MRIALLLAGALCLVWASASAVSSDDGGHGGAAADHRQGTNAGNASLQVTDQR